MVFALHIKYSPRLVRPAGNTPRQRSWRDLISWSAVVSLLVVVTVLAGPTAAAGLPAFPGAEGAGALAVGGRGGAVCRVTSLNDSGVGSLRHCVERDGPRTVIFDVGGTIKLMSQITISNPYITIAGQTAPGGGIQIKADKNWTGGDRDLLRINADHAIVRFLRLRKGYTGDKAGNIRVGNASNIIVDHVSLFWSENQNWTVQAGGSNVTLQNSIVTEMVDGRPNILLAANSEAQNLSIVNLDHHNNLISSSGHRNPHIRAGSTRWVNNVFYNWRGWASRGIGGTHIDWISNLWKPGGFEGSRGQFEINQVRWTEGMDRPINREPSLYIQGNRGLKTGMSPGTDNWSYTREAGPGENDGVLGSMPEAWRRSEPLPTVGIAITVRHVDELEEYLLPVVGASKRLDCKGGWVPNRDTADERVVEAYVKDSGLMTEGGQYEDIYGGHPFLASGVACVDTSGDGVPDEWSLANGFDPADPSLGAKVHESGYTYLELYLNGVQVVGAPPARIQIRVD